MGTTVGWDGVGLESLRGLFQPSWLYDSTSLTLRLSFEFLEVCCCDHEDQGTTNNGPYLQLRKNGLHRSKKVLFSLVSSKVFQLHLYFLNSALFKLPSEGFAINCKKNKTLDLNMFSL